MIDSKTVNKFWKRHNRLMKLGIKLGLVRGYSEVFIERLRDVYYGGIPASIILLNPRSCRGKCYDRAVLACFALTDIDYQVVHANIDTIRYNRKTVDEVNYYLSQGMAISEKYPNHCFVEFQLNGITWVLDTTDALVYEKHFYYLINNPDVNCIRTKEETMAFPDYVDIQNAEIERDKWAALSILPIIEQQIEESSMYKELARREIQFFKDKIHFDELSVQYEEEKQAFFDFQEQRRNEKAMK